MKIQVFKGIFFLVVLLMAAPARPARSQVIPVGDILDDYARLLQIVGQGPHASFGVRPLSVGQLQEPDTAAGSHPWQHRMASYLRHAHTPVHSGLYDVELGTFFNSTRAHGQNDGAMWQGRGGTFRLVAGGFARYRALSVSVRPELLYNQNREFALSTLAPASGLSVYSYPGRGNIDWPQRFGPDPYWTLDWGNSYARLDVGGWSAGFSNEQMWWGPGQRNAIIMSNNAPGFPHAFLGTARPVDVRVGRLETQWIWGHLDESPYFDSLDVNDTRFLTGIVVSLQPRWIPGLYLGATRVYMTATYPEKPSLADYFLVFNNVLKQGQEGADNPTGEDERDQLLSVFARWAFPASGFEVYGEWGRGDHSRDLRDILVEPEHGSGYTLGLQKVFTLPSANRWLRLAAEVTKLEAPRTTLVRSFGAGFFYVHGEVRQGYTQRGQILGAGIGPGSNSQFVGVDLFAPWGRAGFGATRVVYDNDRYYNQPPPNPTFWNHEVELNLGLHGLLFYRGFELGANLTFSRLLNRDYIFKNDGSNLNLGLVVRRSLMGYR